MVIMLTNQEIVSGFLNAIVDISSKGSSPQYVRMIISKFIESNMSEFPFLAYITVKLKKIKVDKEINSINKELIGKSLNKMVHSLFSDLFILLVKKKVPAQLSKSLEHLGIRLRYGR